MKVVFLKMHQYFNSDTFVQAKEKWVLKRKLSNLLKFDLSE